MGSPRITRALHHAVLLSMATPPLACGGVTTGSTGATVPGDAGLDANDDAESGTPAATCMGAGNGFVLSGNAESCAVDWDAASPYGFPGCMGSSFVNLPLIGQLSACVAYDGGQLTADQCCELCGPSRGGVPGVGAPVQSCTLYVDNTVIGAGTPTPTLGPLGGFVSCNYGACTFGRRPEGLDDAACAGPTPAARFWAHAAYLEAASVDAFQRLARELAAHGAPRRLIMASLRAARDEIRHARVTGSFAARAGAAVPECRVPTGEVRSLGAIALENAVEGCVRETFGAAVAMIQAERAGDVQVRRAMKRIARDETRHAELSWAVARWIEPQLDADTRHRVREAQAKAVAALVGEAGHEPDARLTERLGVPDASQARAVLAELEAALWDAGLVACARGNGRNRTHWNVARDPPPDA
jgi:hypothetical protein